jgi:hypothetical protein
VRAIKRSQTDANRAFYHFILIRLQTVTGRLRPFVSLKQDQYIYTIAMPDYSCSSPPFKRASQPLPPTSDGLSHRGADLQYTTKMIKAGKIANRR